MCKLLFHFLYFRFPRVLIHVFFFCRVCVFCFCRVNPIYFVFFTTATIIASAIMYRGWHTNGAVNTVSLMCGFMIIFAGVYLLDSIARKTNGSVALPPVASASSLHRYDSKSNLSVRTSTVDSKQALARKGSIDPSHPLYHSRMNLVVSALADEQASVTSAHTHRHQLQVAYPLEKRIPSSSTCRSKRALSV